MLTRAFRRLGHLDRLGRIEGKRLLAQDMLARLKGGDGRAHVRERWGRDDHRIHITAMQDLVKV